MCGSVSVHLVDGTFELFRCFHGAPRARTSDGREVGAARALAATLTALVSADDVGHLAVAFDSIVAPPGSSRGSSSDALIGAQQPLAAAVVRALGITLWPSGRYQADEILSTAAERFAADDAVRQVVICSNDNDFAQCVRGDRVVVLDRIRKVVTDGAAVHEQFGVRPDQIPDLFGLVGDRSDGLPGVPGWGKVSAAALLERYQRIDDIPLDAGKWGVAVRGRERLAAALREHRDEALLCRDLSVLRTDLPVPATLDVVAWRGARRAAVDRLVALLEDDAVVERIPRWREDD
jgi:5'-3' exonuclease